MEIFIYHLLLVAVVCSSTERNVFEINTQFNDLDLFKTLVLGPSSSYGRPDKCAQHCVRNLQCSMFRFSQANRTCQLFGNVVHAGLGQAQTLRGVRYYVYRQDWCPIQNSFFMFRTDRMCVRLSRGYKDYHHARLRCEQFGARLIALTDGNKARAVTDLLENLGLQTTAFLVGASDNTMEGTFVWEDGRNVTSDQWHLREPNGGLGENCAYMMMGKLIDVACHWKYKFICEIAI